MMVVSNKNWWSHNWQSNNITGRDNRLSRGRGYANNNRVKDIKFENNKITAKVDGSYYNNYNVSIEYEEFSQDQKDKIINIIENDNEILSNILNNKLPRKLIDEINIDFDELTDIDLFESNIGMHCNCPDYAVPCKHISALKYIIGSEIDKNPLKLFEIHGLNLLEEFKLDDFNQILTVDDYFQDTNDNYESKDFYPINFDHIPDISDKIFDMLEDDPLLYKTNFKNVLMDLYKNFKRSFGTILIKMHHSYYYSFVYLDENFRDNDDDKHLNFLNKWKKPHKWDEFTIDIDENFKISENNKQGNILFGDKELVGFLLELNSYGDGEQYHENIRFAHYLLKFVQHLLANKSIIPLLLQSDNQYIIRWQPALFNMETKAVLEELYKMVPDNFITYRGEKISKKKQVLGAISTLINILLNHFYHKMTLKLKKNRGEPIFDLFVGKTISKEDIAQNDVVVLNQWLSSFSYKNRNYKVYLEVEEMDDGLFAIDFKVDEKRLSDIIQNKEKNFGSVLADSFLIKQYFPQLQNIINTGEKVELELDEFTDILINIIPLLETIGISAILPKSLHKLTTTKLALSPSSQSFKSKRYITQNDLKKFNWEVAVGDQLITIEEFEKAVKNSKGIVKIANNYVILSEKEIRTFIKKFKKISKEETTLYDLIKAISTGEFKDVEIKIDTDFKESFNNLIKESDVELPKTVKADLRDYQSTGFSWLVQNINNNFGSILADDMGLGKTLQTLATIDYFKQKGDLEKEKVLIVMPTGLLFNWKKEIEKFTPNLKPYIYHGTGRKLPKKGFDIILTTYGVLRSDVELLNERKWFLIVIDEAQNIKNPITKQAKAVKSIKAKNRIALSGTPVENRLLEYWSIFDFTNPTYLPNMKTFMKEYINPIENERNEYVLNKFKSLTEPFILRRLKTDKSIIDDLPDKIVNDIYCNLTKKQAALYQETVNSLMKIIENEDTDNIKRKGLILKMINALKQICNHPAHFSKSNKYKINESGKMEILISILENILANDEKVIIFTQYVQMGNIIKKLLEKHFKEDVGFLKGSLNKEKRNEIVDKFQNDPKSKILLASLKSGGTGLNLTAAQNVIHYDLWWNPAVENQATDRAYRIGQKNNVMVYRFITSGTFEEKINEMIKEKEELADLTVSSNEKFITEMDNKELSKLLSMR